jgi:predicted dehydrogenase
VSNPIHWGILGAGNIARSFATGLQVLPQARLVAIGSRSLEKANAFGEAFGIPHRYGSYQDLVADPEVDVIYVATPHPLHKEHSLLALEAGKAVLCEKPFTLNAQEAREVIACARRKRLFLMEAMWTRCLPLMDQVRQWLAAGVIGEPRMLTADFGFRAEVNPEGRLFNLALGGGSLLDIGVYTVALASMVFGGPPTRITGLAHLGETGVDEQAAFILGYGQGQLALLSSAIRTNTPQEARIDGTRGRIRIDSFWRATRATLAVEGQEPQTVEKPFEGNGYHYEAAEVMRCLEEGQLESPLIPLEETVSILETLDEIRRQWGLRYPTEEPHR